jgi:integrase/recombinase XerD
LQAGVDVTVIVVWLGHESIETSNVYAHANLSMREKALAKIQPMDTPFRRFRPDDRLRAARPPKLEPTTTVSRGSVVTL